MESIQGFRTLDHALTMAALYHPWTTEKNDEAILLEAASGHVKEEGIDNSQYGFNQG